jgi:hypothetical protein
MSFSSLTDSELLLEALRSSGVLFILLACGFGIVARSLTKVTKSHKSKDGPQEESSKGLQKEDEAELYWSNGYGQYKYLGLHDDPFAMAKAADYSLKPLNMVLPELTSEQKGCLSSLSSRVVDLEHTGSIRVDPSTLIRYLRSREWNVDEAEKFLRYSAKYRETHDMNRMFTHWNLEAYEECLKPWWLSGGYIGHGRNQEPIAIERIGRCNFAKLVDMMPFEDLLRLDMVNAQRMLAAIEEDAIRRGKPLMQVLVIMDLEGFGMDQVKIKAARSLSKLIESRCITLTEVTKKVLAVNAPPAAAKAWALMKHLLDPGTAAKVEVVTAKDTFETLRRHIDESVIPGYLGGLRHVDGDQECRRFIAPGGLPPQAAIDRFSKLVRKGKTKAQQARAESTRSKWRLCCG